MRIVRGGLALVALVAGMVGVPWALVLLGGNPFPAQWDLDAIRRALLRPDDGTVLVGLIALVAWAAWLVFTVSVVVELAVQLVRGLSGRRLEIGVPGLAGPRRLVAGLVLAVLALASGPGHAQADPPATSSIARPAETSHRIGPSPSDTDVTATAAPRAAAPRAAVPGTESTRHRHVVEPGDDLWTLAERYYGEGREWRTIARANPDLLTGGPDRLQPGWCLAIPGADTTTSRVHEVSAGDTLSSIAAAAYGDSDRWHELFLANRAQLSDPDDLAVGVQLTLPSQAEIGRREARAPQGDAETQSGQEPTAPERETAASAKPVPPRPLSSERAAPTEGATPVPPPRPLPSERAAPTRGPTTAAAPASAPPGSEPSPEVLPAAADVAAENDPTTAVVAGLVSIGGLLAAGLMIGLQARRRAQRQLRPVGRRILAPPDPAEAVEATLGRRQQPLGRRTLDLAVRAIGAHCRHTASPLPTLELVRLADHQIMLEIAGPATPPAGFRVDGSTWVLEQARVDRLRAVAGVSEAARPYPALVCVGRDQDGAQLLVDLEQVGLMGVAGGPEVTEAVLTALAAELAFSAWSDEMVLTLVGMGGPLAEALDQHNVSVTDDLDLVLDRLEARATVQREQEPAAVLGQRRIEPDLADPWVPEIVLVGGLVTDHQRARLADLLLVSPRVTMAAVFGGDHPDTPWVLELGEPAGAVTLRRPFAAAISVVPQRIDAPAAAALGDLVRAASSEETGPAPWWDAGDSPPSPTSVRYVERWGEDREQWSTREGAENVAEDSGTDVRHPMLLLLGPVDLVGATGSVPPRASRQCLEYCAWLLHRRETTARAMAAGLAVAEGTRRSNMSRLRTWLGHDEMGQPYLPDAYSGHITLHPLVSSDWHRLQMLTTPAVNRVSTSALCAALQLVRGAPLADAAPGQWHWAEEMRTDMISVVRDIGVELSTRALAERDIDLARWAASHALVVAPGDELLIRARIRTEHQAGNAVEVERLILQLASQARSLGIDLDPETVVLLQEMMEGQVRARLA